LGAQVADVEVLLIKLHPLRHHGLLVFVFKAEVLALEVGGRVLMYGLLHRLFKLVFVYLVVDWLLDKWRILNLRLHLLLSHSRLLGLLCIRGDVDVVYRYWLFHLWVVAEGDVANNGIRLAVRLLLPQLEAWRLQPLRAVVARVVVSEADEWVLGVAKDVDDWLRRRPLFLPWAGKRLSDAEAVVEIYHFLKELVVRERADFAQKTEVAIILSA